MGFRPLASQTSVYTIPPHGQNSRFSNHLARLDEFESQVRRACATKRLRTHGLPDEMLFSKGPT